MQACSSVPFCSSQYSQSDILQSVASNDTPSAGITAFKVIGVALGIFFIFSSLTVLEPLGASLVILGALGVLSIAFLCRTPRVSAYLPSFPRVLMPWRRPASYITPSFSTFPVTRPVVYVPPAPIIQSAPVIARNYPPVRTAVPVRPAQAEEALLVDNHHRFGSGGHVGIRSITPISSDGSFEGPNLSSTNHHHFGSRSPR